MPLLKVTKVYPDGTTEDVTPVEEVKKPATRRKTRASKNSKKEQEQQGLGKAKEEDSGA